MREKPGQSPVFFYPRTQTTQEPWRPAMDIYRTPDGWLLKFDLAGVRMEDVEVTVKGCHITVSGERRDWLREEGCSYYSMEISYSRFERTVKLPCELRHPKVEMQERNGWLVIRVTPEEGQR